MFKIELTSVEDREKLVVELWWNDHQLAELSQDQGHRLIQFYRPPSGAFWEFDYAQFAEKLSEMPRLLEGK